MIKNSILKIIFWPFLQYRAKEIAGLIIPHINQNENVLDVGCGNMLVSQEIVYSRQIKVQGIDVLEMNLTNLPFALFNGKEIPYPDKHYDTCLLIGVLHHVKNQELLLDEAKRISSKIIIIEDIYSGGIEKIWTKIRDILGNVPEEPRMNFALNFHSDSEWSKIFVNHGLKLIHRHNWWNPLRLTHHGLYVLSCKS